MLTIFNHQVSNLTDQAIFALAERTTLERIHLSYCEHVSVAAIQFLLSRLSRLNHLSLTGVPAFRRADLQHFCRPPPKDFNPHQRSTFCVYSGKGVHELRKHLMALQQHELAGGMNGANSLIPPASAFHNQNNQHPNQTFHHHQFAQMQLGNNGQQNQQLPTYPHLFQHPAGHAVISQMPLQSSQDDGEDVDEDVDEEDDDNGDDEADEDRATPEGQSSASRRHHHSQHQYRQASSSNAQSSHSHNHRHHSHQQQRSYITSQQANGQSNLSAQASTFAPVPYYRGNHRMTGQTDLIEGSNSPSSETAGVGTSTSAPQAAGGPMYSLNFYSTELQPPVTHGQIQQHYQQNLLPVSPNASAWLGQITGNEPLTQIRVPPASSGAGPSRSSVPGQQSGSSSTGWRPFTPVRSPHTSRPTSSYTAAQPAQEASTHESNGSSEMDLMDTRASPEVRQRSYSVDMDLNTEDEPQIGTDSVDDGLSRTLRPRRDTIMQSTYRQESA